MVQILYTCRPNYTDFNSTHCFTDCPSSVIAVTSSDTGLADFDLHIDDVILRMKLPEGNYQYRYETVGGDQPCIVNVQVNGMCQITFRSYKITYNLPPTHSTEPSVYKPTYVWTMCS